MRQAGNRWVFLSHFRGRPHLMSVCVQKQKYHGIVGSCNPACPNNEGQTLLFADSPAAAMLQSGTGGDTGDDDERSRPTETPDGGDTNRPLLATEASEERSSEQAPEGTCTKPEDDGIPYDKGWAWMVVVG